MGSNCCATPESLRDSKIVGIRHAQSLHNAANVFTRKRDPQFLDAGLSPTGIK